SCIVCEYDIKRPQRPSTSDDDAPTAGDYAGFMMTPSKIETVAGEVRMLGYPLIEEVPEQDCLSSDGVVNARHFLENTTFEDRSGFKMVSVLSVFGELWSDDDGDVRKHLRLTSATADDIVPFGLETDLMPLIHDSYEGEDDEDDDEDDFDEEDEEELTEANRIIAPMPKLVEKRVDSGTMVVVIGIYDEARRGLVPPRGAMTANRLMIGTAEQIESKLRRSMVSYAIGGMVVLLLLHAAIYFAVQRQLGTTDREPPAEEARAEQAFGKWPRPV
ncbi:MAG: hypothetical protein WBW32_05595, partial [Luteibacter sp.]